MKEDNKVIAFDIRNKIPEKDPKATKEEFAYVEDKTNPNCGFCSMYLIGRKCTIVSGDIDPENGSCNYWSYRRTQPKEPSGNLKKRFTKDSAGYVQTKGGPRCGTCEYFSAPSSCSKVIGEVNPIKGCCIYWENE